MKFSTFLTLAVSAAPLAWAAPTPQEDSVVPAEAVPAEAERILAEAQAQAVAEAEAAGYDVELPESALSKRTLISACTILEIAFSSRTYFPGSTEYETENTRE